MLHESPARRKPLEDISNRNSREHVTPKKRRLDVAGVEKEKEDEILFNNVPPRTPTEKKTPVRLSLPSSARKANTPVSNTKPQTTFEENSTRKDLRYMDIGANMSTSKPFPTMEQEHHHNDDKLGAEVPRCKDEIFKDSIRKATAERSLGGKQYFRDLSIHLECLRRKYHFIDDLSPKKSVTELPGIVYTEIPIVKSKLADWKEKYLKNKDSY